jgi:predicted O-linked N-acetylglucosamine transferase (SPINDLY family)
LREILDKSTESIVYRFFTGVGKRCHNGFLALQQDLQDVLGAEHVHVFPEVPYQRYMELMEEGDFAIDSWPFGGYNSILDSLWLGKPVLSLEGDRFINRASSALLRQVGLEELITHSSEEYANCALRLIHDHSWRLSIQERICSVDLESTVFNPGYATNFKKTIDYLIQNHARLKTDMSRKPIIIE